MSHVGFYLASMATIVALLGRWWWEWSRLRQRRAGIHLRIHVNGIRGKSSVTRLLAGMLREAELVTLAKTTGTDARFILPDGTDEPIRRVGPPTILEQVHFIDRIVPDSIEAIVVECMALDPYHQAVCETHVLRAHIGVITNVREDHQDVMGRTLPEITRSLLNMCPHDGVLLTAEQDPQLQQIMRLEARCRGSDLLVADPDSVSDDDLRVFSGVVFKENVALGLAVATLVGVPRKTALCGMARAEDDPGVLKIRHAQIGDKQVTWVNLFASNDRQSVVSVVKDLMAEHRTARTTTVAVLNNRADRDDRALLFADVAALDLPFDRVATLGAMEGTVVRRLTANGYPRERIVPLGEHRKLSLTELLQSLVLDMPTPHVLLFGMVNIKTAQAEVLAAYLEQEEGASEGAPEVQKSCGK